MKILGLDLGLKTLGIAISDALLIASYPFETHHFKYKDFDDPKNYVLDLIKKENIKEIALGLPLHLSGDLSPMADFALKFKEMLISENPDLIVEMIDERFTSVIANKTLLEADISREKRKKIVDSLAAQEILSTYLEMKKRKNFAEK